MRRSTLAMTALFVAALGDPLASAARAQPRVNTELQNQVAQQLVTLNETMTQMQQVLERQLETQTLDLLLKRAQLASSEVARLDRALRRATDRRTALEAERVQLELRAETLDDLGRSRRDEGPSDEDLEIKQRTVRVQTEIVEGRLRTLDSEIVDLEGRLESKRQDLESWQEVLDRRLSGV